MKEEEPKIEGGSKPMPPENGDRQTEQKPITATEKAAETLRAYFTANPDMRGKLLGLPTDIQEAAERTQRFAAVRDRVMINLVELKQRDKYLQFVSKNLNKDALEILADRYTTGQVIAKGPEELRREYLSLLEEQKRAGERQSPLSKEEGQSSKPENMVEKAIEWEEGESKKMTGRILAEQEQRQEWEKTRKKVREIMEPVEARQEEMRKKVETLKEAAKFKNWLWSAGLESKDPSKDLAPEEITRLQTIREKIQQKGLSGIETIIKGFGTLQFKPEDVDFLEEKIRGQHLSQRDLQSWRLLKKLGDELAEERISRSQKAENRAEAGAPASAKETGPAPQATGEQAPPPAEAVAPVQAPEGEARQEQQPAAQAPERPAEAYETKRSQKELLAELNLHTRIAERMSALVEKGRGAKNALGLKERDIAEYFPVLNPDTYRAYPSELKKVAQRMALDTNTNFEMFLAIFQTKVARELPEAIQKRIAEKSGASPLEQFFNKVTGEVRGENLKERRRIREGREYLKDSKIKSVIMGEIAEIVEKKERAIVANLSETLRRQMGLAEEYRKYRRIQERQGRVNAILGKLLSETEREPVKTQERTAFGVAERLAEQLPKEVTGKSSRDLESFLHTQGLRIKKFMRSRAK